MTADVATANTIAPPLHLERLDQLKSAQSARYHTIVPCNNNIGLDVGTDIGGGVGVGVSIVKKAAERAREGTV